MQSGDPTDENIALTIAMTSVYVTSEITTLTDAFPVLRNASNEHYAHISNPNLALLAAFALCRLTGECSAVDERLAVDLEPEDLKDPMFVSDAWRIARMSDRLWSRLANRSANSVIGSPT